MKIASQYINWKFAVGVTGMGADRDLVPERELDRGPHGALVPGMPTTRDVGARDERHDVRVRPGPFAEVAVEVDRSGHAQRLRREPRD